MTPSTEMKGKVNFCNILSRKSQRHYLNTVNRFKKTTRFYGLFKLLFFSLFLSEIAACLVSYSRFSSTPIFAVLLGLIFLTIFTYFVLSFYFQTKKPEQLTTMKERFIQSCRQSLAIPSKTAEHHLSIAQATLRLSYHLHQLEYRYFIPSKFFHFLQSPLEKLSFAFFHEDVFRMKEMLILAGINEHILQIRYTPSDLEVHASLANAYVSLAKLYKEILEQVKYKRLQKKMGKLLEAKFEVSSKRAIEELKILNDFAPNDPWVHAQLARCYRSLGNKQEEAVEYEKILQISPHDYEVLFRLGVIYFEVGNNAKALRIYDQLRLAPFKNADDLLAYYGVMQDRDLLEETF